MTHLSIEPDGAQETGTCECCGSKSKSVWGRAYRDERAAAAYFVHWTIGHVGDQGANFDLILGSWGEGTSRTDRAALSFRLRHMPSGPSFMIIDAAERPVASSDLVGKCLSRPEVVGTPLAKEAFEILDAIWIQDDRIAEVTTKV